LKKYNLYKVPTTINAAMKCAVITWHDTRLGRGQTVARDGMTSSSTVGDKHTRRAASRQTAKF